MVEELKKAAKGKKREREREVVFLLLSLSQRKSYTVSLKPRLRMVWWSCLSISANQQKRKSEVRFTVDTTGVITTPWTAML